MPATRSPCPPPAATVLGTVLRATPWLLAAAAMPAQSDAERRMIVSVQQIWEAAPHNAFPDLVRYGGFLWCAFREGTGHVPGTNGVIRVIRGRLDGTDWEAVQTIEEEGVDLRDPKLSVTPDERLMVLMGGSVYVGSERTAMAPRVAFAKAVVFSGPTPVELPESVASGHDWLWRVTWHADQAFGVVYQPTDDGSHLHLVRSDDGVRYRHVARLDVAAARRPNETTLRFLSDGRMAALVRCEAGDQGAVLGVAEAPFTAWRWHDLGARIGGPELLPIAAGDGVHTLLFAGRAYDSGGARTALWRTTLTADGALGGPLARLLTLPSGGDNSYPALLPTEDGARLFCGYYSSHLEGRATILLAELRLPRLLD